MSKLKLTIEELLEKLSGSHNLTVKDINDLERFLSKNRLKTRYINAVNKSFNSLGDVAEEVFNLEIAVVGRNCLLSCLVDWSLNPDDNWEYIHSEWLIFE